MAVLLLVAIAAIDMTPILGHVRSSPQSRGRSFWLAPVPVACGRYRVGHSRMRVGWAWVSTNEPRPCHYMRVYVDLYGWKRHDVIIISRLCVIVHFGAGMAARAKVEDKRVRRTKRAIREALLRPLEDKPVARVTTTELCREAGVNRNPFCPLLGARGRAC